MNAIKHIRKNVFEMTQAQFAEAVGVMQSTVSRWENGVEPDRADLVAIRSVAMDRGFPDWSDDLLFVEQAR